MFGASPYIYASRFYTPQNRKGHDQKDGKVFDVNDLCQYVEEAD